MAGWSSRRRLRTGSAGCMSFATTGRSRPRHPTPRPHPRRCRRHPTPRRRRHPDGAAPTRDGAAPPGGAGVLGLFRVHPPIDGPGPADRQRRRRALTDRRRGMTRAIAASAAGAPGGSTVVRAPSRCGRDCRRYSRGPRRPRRHRVGCARRRSGRSRTERAGRCLGRWGDPVGGRRRTRGGARSVPAAGVAASAGGPTSRGLTGRRRTGRCRIRPGRRRIAMRRPRPGRAVEWPAREKHGEAAG